MGASYWRRPDNSKYSMEADNETILQCVMNAYVLFLRHKGQSFGTAMHEDELAAFNIDSPHLKLRLRKAQENECPYYARVNMQGKFFRSPYHPFKIREDMLKVIEQRNLSICVPDMIEALFKDIKYLNKCHILWNDCIFYVEPI